jgi:hypothetical protein
MKYIQNMLRVSEIFFTVFLVNKLTHAGSIANWSWWWVCSPVIIGITFNVIYELLIKSKNKPK